MSQLTLLLKYSFKNKVRPKKDKYGQEKKSSAMSGVFGYLLPAAVFGIFIGFLFFMTFQNLNIPLADFGISSSFSLMDIFLSISLIGLGIFFFISYSPSIIVNLFDSEMTGILLTMPVKKSTIFLSAAVDSLLLSGLSLGMMIPLGVIYPIIYGNSLNLSIPHMIFSFVVMIISLLLFIGILLGVSLLGGIFMSNFMGKTAAKKLSMLAYFGAILLYVFAANFITPDKINVSNAEVLVNNLKNALGFVLSPLWPHTHFLGAMRGSFISFLILVLMNIVIYYLVFLLTRNMNMISTGKKIKEKKSDYKVSSNPLLKKDLKLLFRDSQSLFLLLYPLIFPFILFFTGSINMAFISIMFNFIASFYASFLSVMMIMEERKIWPNPKLYPIDTKRLIKSKIYIPIIIFAGEFLILDIVSFFFSGFESLIFGLIMLIPVLIILIYSSLVGAKMFFKNPKRDVKQKNILSGKETITLEGLSIVFSIGIFIPMSALSVYIKSGPFWIFEKMSPVLNYLILLGIPLLLIFLLIYLCKKESKELNILLEKEE